jgi:phage terminase Nu1 subunit (DNA packaging protein)
MRSHSVRIAFACAVACLTLGAPAAAVEVQGRGHPPCVGSSEIFTTRVRDEARKSPRASVPKGVVFVPPAASMPIPNIVTTAELARLCACAHDTIRNYKLAGVITPVMHGKWNARECIRAIVGHLIARSAQVTAGPVANDPGDLVQQRALLAHAQRRKLEREHAEAMAQLLDGDAARAAWAAEHRHVRAALMALPDRLAPQLVDAQSLHRVRVVLVNAIDATLQALADDDGPVVPEPPDADA